MCVAAIYIFGVKNALANSVPCLPEHTIWKFWNFAKRKYSNGNWKWSLHFEPWQPKWIILDSSLQADNIFVHQILLNLNFMVTPCISDIQHFNIQLLHKTLKNVVIKTF